MSIATYSDLKSQVASFLHRDDLTSNIVDFIALAEAAMQLKFRLIEHEQTVDVAVTSGVGTLPSDFQGARSVYWSDGTTAYELQYITPEWFDARQNITADVPGFYTTTGSSLKVSPATTGTATLTYFGRFTPLSDSNTTNSVLTNSPDVYLYGALHHASIYTRDDEAMKTYGILFNAAMDRVIEQDMNKKFPAQLAVRPR